MLQKGNYLFWLVWLWFVVYFYRDRFLFEIDENF
jgi:hypothetical protein